MSLLNILRENRALLALALLPLLGLGCVWIVVQVHSVWVFWYEAFFYERCVIVVIDYWWAIIDTQGEPDNCLWLGVAAPNGWLAGGEYDPLNVSEDEGAYLLPMSAPTDTIWGKYRKDLALSLENALPSGPDAYWNAWDSRMIDSSELVDSLAGGTVHFNIIAPPYCPDGEQHELWVALGDSVNGWNLTTELHIPVTIGMNDTIATGVMTGDNQVPGLELNLKNVPNPFNPTTSIKFRLREKAPVEIQVYDASGKLVRTLHSGMLEAGDHTVVWDGKDNNGRNAPSGVYFTRLGGERLAIARKMVLLR